MNGIFYTKQNGENVAIYLPVIVYSKEKGLNFFPPKDWPMDRNIRDIRLKKKVI